MKNHILLTIALLTGYSHFVSGQSDDCAKCGQRMIKCWDLNIYTAKPVTSADSVLWKQLHYASEGYIGRFLTVESSECLAFLPACRIGDSTPPWQNTCPYNGQEAGGDYDYEIFGDISGSEGAYTLKLSLVTIKRETVVQVVRRFEKASDAKWQGELASLGLGGTEAGSRRLYETIHEFELKKRDASNGVRFNRIALNASTKITSTQSQVKPGDRSPIDFELKDCDGEPLKAAKLVLHASKGGFEKNEVETDENGKARAVFIAPDEKCKADIKVEYNYDHPGGKQGFTSDFTTIEVSEQRFVQFAKRYYGTEAKGTVPVEIKLSGCDSKAMSAVTLELSAQYGTFTNSKIKPDITGTARASYKAPDKGVDDNLKVVHRYTASDGTPLEISDNCVIRVLKPTDSLYADIKLYLFDKEVLIDGQGKLISDNENASKYSTTLECSVGHDVIRMIRSLGRPLTPAERKARLTVLSGASMIDIYSPDYSKKLYSKKYPLKIAQHVIKKDYRQVKGEKIWVTSYTKLCNGISKNDGLQISVEKMRNPGALENAPDHCYSLLINGVGLENTEERGIIRCWDDQEGRLKECNPACTLLNPGKTAFSDQEYYENEKVEPIIIRATGTEDQVPEEGDEDPFSDKQEDPLTPLISTGFEDYLLGPVGDITLFLEGSSFLYEEGRRSLWRYAHVILRLYPKDSESIKSDTNDQAEEDDIFNETDPEADILRKQALERLKKYIQEHPGSMFDPSL